jgi:adenylate cyclase class 2
MQTEIEAKSLDVDHDALRAKLRALGATLEQPMRLLRRYNLDFADRRLRDQPEGGGWVRVRDEGDKVTLSYKQLNDRTLHGTKEICVTVNSFDDAKALLEAIGLGPTSYQETRRESWRLGDLQIELDQWPWTKPYIEIEAPDESSLKDIFAKLDLAWDTAVFGSVEVVYRGEYDISDEEFDALSVPFTFEAPVPEALASKQKTGKVTAL